MQSLHKPPEHLVAAGLPPFSSLVLSTLFSYALSIAHVWVMPVLMYAGIASCCVVVYTTLYVRSMCRSMLEATSVAVKMGLSVIRTIARFFLVRDGQQRFPNWTLQMEIVIDALRLVLEQCGGRISEPWVASALRNRSVVLGAIDGRIACYMAGGVSIESLRFRGLEHIWLKSASSSTERGGRRQRRRGRCVVLFLHGGGFASACPQSYISSCVRILAAIRSELEATRLPSNEPLHVDMLLANYRKAPENPYPAGPNDAYAMYKYLLDHEGLAPSQIIIAGDSAGASLALTTLTTVRDATPHAQPLAGVLICPFVDLDPAMVPANHEAPHCMLSNEAAVGSLRGYASGGVTPRSDPNLRGLPPMLVQAGSLDLLYNNAVDLVARGRQQSECERHWELDVHEDMPHDFTMAPSWLLPYSSVGIARIAVFVAKQLSAIDEGDE